MVVACDNIFGKEPAMRLSQDDSLGLGTWQAIEHDCPSTLRMKEVGSS